MPPRNALCPRGKLSDIPEFPVMKAVLQTYYERERDGFLRTLRGKYFEKHTGNLEFSAEVSALFVIRLTAYQRLL